MKHALIFGGAVLEEKAYRVVTSNVQEMNEKIHRHRRRILLLTGLVVVLLLGTVTGVYLYIQTKIYTKYEILNSAQRKDAVGTVFESFQGNVIKYSKDGASCIDEDNHIIWNQTYEMQAPMVDTCENYVVVADKKGEHVYIMDIEGACGEIKTTMPIQRVQVANQGVVAVLMEQGGTGYIHVYDREGKFLAGGELHTQNTGYPLDISISNDGQKLAVTLLDVNEGNVKSTIIFYNFDVAGQKEIDNIVSKYSYSDMVFPKVEFLTNDVLAAFGNGKVVIFEGAQKPQAKTEISVEQEIRSIFYNEMYIGLVFENENKKSPFVFRIFDLMGTEVLSKDFDMKYQEIGFLENDEICIRNDLECAIYSLRGIEKFHGNFDKNIWKVTSTNRFRDYIFWVEGETQKVRLK